MRLTEDLTGDVLAVNGRGDVHILDQFGRDIVIPFPRVKAVGNDRARIDDDVTEARHLIEGGHVIRVFRGRRKQTAIEVVLVFTACEPFIPMRDRHVAEHDVPRKDAIVGEPLYGRERLRRERDHRQKHTKHEQSSQKPLFHNFLLVV